MLKVKSWILSLLCIRLEKLPVWPKEKLMRKHIKRAIPKAKLSDSLYYVKNTLR